MNEARRSTFYWAMRLMPTTQRRAIFAVYAWCRTVDDIADADLPADTRLAALASARRDLDHVFAGDDTELARAVRRHGLERAWFEMVLDGCERDVSDPLHAPEMEMLERYCRQVAGAPARMAVAIFGCEDEAASAFAFTGGTALQLTNILRDIDEDTARGRCYLPREALATSDARAWLAEQAIVFYERAEESARRSDRRRLWPGLAMLRLYRRLLDRMPSDERPRLGTFEALVIVLACRFGW